MGKKCQFCREMALFCFYLGKNINKLTNPLQMLNCVSDAVGGRRLGTPAPSREWVWGGWGGGTQWGLLLCRFVVDAFLP